MADRIERGLMVFVADGREGIGAVRQVSKSGLVIYVENAGEFDVPLSAVTDVHSGKVMLNPKLLSRAFLQAVGHAHDSEDPNLVG